MMTKTVNITALVAIALNLAACGENANNATLSGDSNAQPACEKVAMLETNNGRNTAPNTSTTQKEMTATAPLGLVGSAGASEVSSKPGDSDADRLGHVSKVDQFQKDSNASVQNLKAKPCIPDATRAEEHDATEHIGQQDDDLKRSWQKAEESRKENAPNFGDAITNARTQNAGDRLKDLKARASLPQNAEDNPDSAFGKSTTAKDENTNTNCAKMGSGKFDNISCEGR